MAIKSNFTKAFYGFLCGMLIVSCDFTNANVKSVQEVTGNPKITAPEIDFSQIDSVECVYPKRANENKGTVSFFIKDSNFINTLKKDLAATQKPAAECTHEVKLYLYKKGEVFKTVYAALHPQCNYLAYAINGQPFFVPLSFNLHQLLRAHLTTATAPLL